MIEEALENYRDKIEALIVPSHLMEEYENKAKGLALIQCKSSDIERLSTHSTYDGPIAVLQQSEESSIIHQQPLYLFLDGITDPGNLGTIVRLADWYGLKQIYCSLACVEFYHPKSISSSMGSILRIGHLSTSFHDLKEGLGTMEIYLADLDGTSIYKINPKTPCILVIGSESHGISKDIKANKDTHLITIPRRGKAESLNAAVSTGILLDNLLTKIDLR